MHSAIKLTHLHGYYQSRNQLAISVGPHRSQDYGYRIVNRCIRKGLLDVDQDHDGANPHGDGAVVVTEKGMDYINKEINE